MKVDRANLVPGTRYYAVFSPSGACIGRYTTEAEARAVVARAPDRLEYREHVR
jgi:regulator of extracellular matrix RemA (YlzA/DUF370 family)